MKEFQLIELYADEAKTFSDWWLVYNRLVKWQLDLDDQKESNLNQILNEQFLSCNKKFTQFIDSEYPNRLSTNERPTLSVDIFNNKIKPLLELNEKVCFLVMDAMRLDHFMELYPIMSDRSFHFDITICYTFCEKFYFFRFIS